MLELFSRVPDELQIAEDGHLPSVPVSEEVLSLSAILFDDGCYRLIHERKRDIGGPTIIGVECL